MLQIITAHRILSYQQKLLAMNENLHETEALLLHQMKQFRQEHGPVFNLLHVIQSQSPAMALAAEFKRASPSKGMIAAVFSSRASSHPGKIAFDPIRHTCADTTNFPLVTHHGQ
jgi:hypothetical protein